MSANAKNPPAATHFDGPTFVKVWRNANQDGTPRYTSTVGYIYTDKESGEVRESRNLRDNDLLRLPGLAPRARQSIHKLKTQDRENGRTSLEVERRKFSQAPKEATPKPKDDFGREP